MAALRIFYEEVFPRCKKTAMTVDIEALEKVNILSPEKASLQYSEAEKSLSGAAEIIVRNFATNFASVGEFSRFAVMSMENVLSSKVGIADFDAQKILMVHCSKAEADLSFISNFFKKCAKMTIVRNIDVQLESWKSLAMKVSGNQHVNEVINNAIREYGVDVSPKGNEKLNLVYVNFTSPRLRGFSGINTIYINSTHFTATKLVFHGAIDKPLLDLILQVDIINCAIHELAHIKLRMSTNDFNTSSPTLARGKNLPENYFEFGRYVEGLIFGKAIDWAESADSLTTEYRNSVVSAIELNAQIQQPASWQEMVLREAITSMALDYSLSRTFC